MCCWLNWRQLGDRCERGDRGFRVWAVKTKTKPVLCSRGSKKHRMASSSPLAREMLGLNWPTLKLPFVKCRVKMCFWTKWLNLWFVNCLNYKRHTHTHTHTLLTWPTCVRETITDEWSQFRQSNNISVQGSQVYAICSGMTKTASSIIIIILLLLLLIIIFIIIMKVIMSTWSA